MSISDRIMRQIETLSEEERQAVIKKIKEKYFYNDAIILNENYTWWDNEEDDVYNER